MSDKKKTDALTKALESFQQSPQLDSLAKKHEEHHPLGEMSLEQTLAALKVASKKNPPKA